MGRSVEVVRREAGGVIYFDIRELCSEDDPYLWDDLIENIQCSVKSHFKSFDTPDRKWVDYPYRENKIILENDHCTISVSEYCGCGAICVFNSDSSEYPELSQAWTGKNFEKIDKIVGQCVIPLHRIGGFSDGTSVYERVKG